MQQPHPGFRHRDLIVYALQYELATEPPSWLIVWLDGDGNSLYPWVQPAEPQKRIVTTKPGDVLLHHGEPKTVAGVSIYRALGIEPGKAVVG